MSASLASPKCKAMFATALVLTCAADCRPFTVSGGAGPVRPTGGLPNASGEDEYAFRPGYSGLPCSWDMALWVGRYGEGIVCGLDDRRQE